jgi:hypothetical protein
MRSFDARKTVAVALWQGAAYVIGMAVPVSITYVGRLYLPELPRTILADPAVASGIVMGFSFGAGRLAAFWHERFRLASMLAGSLLFIGIAAGVSLALFADEPQAGVLMPTVRMLVRIVSVSVIWSVAIWRVQQRALQPR